jgi:hypothetical protein
MYNNMHESECRSSPACGITGTSWIGLIDWLIIYCFMSCFHLYGDIIITSEGLQNLRHNLESALFSLWFDFHRLVGVHQGCLLSPPIFYDWKPLRANIFHIDCLHAHDHKRWRTWCTVHCVLMWPYRLRNS